MLKMERFTIAIPRNGHYCQDWQMNVRSLDGKSWVPWDLTGYTISLKFKAVSGQGGVIAIADIDAYDLEGGLFTVTASGADFSSVQGQTEIVTVAYDLKLTDQDGISQVQPRGHALLIPGVS